MNIDLCASDFIKMGDTIWFVAINIPYLCCYNEKENRIVKKILVPRGEIKDYRNYERIILHDNHIIGIPYVADYFFRYSIETDELELMRVPWMDNGLVIPYYSLTVPYKNKYFIFRRFMDYSEEETYRVVILAPETFELDSFQITSDLEFNDYGLHGAAFRKQTALVNDSIIMIHGEKNIICGMNLEDKSIRVFRPQEQTVFQTIEYLGEGNYWLLDKYLNIWCWNRIKGFIKREYNVEGFENPYIKLMDSFGHSIKADDKIFIFPYFSNMVIEFDIGKDVLKEASFSRKVVANEFAFSMMSCGCEYEQFSRPQFKDGRIYIWNLWNKKFYIINIDTGSVSVMSINADFNSYEIKNEMKCRSEKQSIIMENSIDLGLTLQWFIEGLIEGET